MVVIFSGMILGFILMFFILAWGALAVVLLVPLVILTIVSIQTFLKIRDRNLDN
jgi:hypothetical protein